MAWISNNNAILIDGCKNLNNLQVTLQVTHDLVTVGNTGFSIQLNAYPQPTSISQGETLNCLQYIIIVGGPVNNQLGWEVQYWCTGAPPTWPPGYTPNPNTSTQLPALPNDYYVQTFGSAPSNQLPKGTVIQFLLATRIDDGGVIEARFSVKPPNAKAQEANFPFPAGAIYPIYGFQVNIVGAGNAKSCEFQSGAGTITYSLPNAKLAVQPVGTSCGGPAIGIGESSNMQYGAFLAGTGANMEQDFGCGSFAGG